MRRKHSFALLFTLVLSSLLAVPTVSGCAPGSLLSGVSNAPTLISPNGDGKDDFTMIAYTVGREALVSIVLTARDSTQYVLREKESRPQGSYVAKFDGSYAPDLKKPVRQLLPDGEYQYAVTADDGKGKVEEKQGKIVIENGDTKPLIVSDFSVDRDAISPDGDAKDDEMRLSYAVSKNAEVTIYAADKDGKSYLLDPPTKRNAGLWGHDWNGTSGDQLLPDGRYVLHVQAKDNSGNISEATREVSINGGGKPQMDILKVKFSPSAVPVGGTLNVEIRVKNSGDVILHSLGPDPGTAYTTEQTFNYWRDDSGQPKYYERPGFWRVGVSWDQAGTVYPFRWGLGKDLAPGEEATITGTIQLLNVNTRIVHFYAAVVQEGVGFPSGEVGFQQITVSF